MKNKLKKLIIERALELSVQHGLDLDGDMFNIFGKRYYVDCLHGKVMEVK